LKKRYSIEIQGIEKRWAFDITAEPRHVADWRRDGLNVAELENTVPVWIVDLGLIRPWCFLQDLWNFK
jgi:hypothetical protein